MCAEQTCRSMDAVSQGLLLANSSHMLLYSRIVWLLYFFSQRAKQMDGSTRWMCPQVRRALGNPLHTSA